MDKVYEYKNAIVYVRSADTYDRENLKKATEAFLKKVISGGTNNGNFNTPRNFRKKQVLHR